MKNKKIVLIIVILVVIIVTAAILLVKPGEDSVVRPTEYEHVTGLLEQYNANNEDSATDILLMESDEELAFMLNGIIESDDNTKQNIFVDYTNMRVNSIVYDKDSNPVKIINMYIDKQYNVIKVDLYDYTTNKVDTYKLNDPKLEEFQKRADLMSDKIKNIFNEETLNGVDLFNKTINDIKETKVSK